LLADAFFLRVDYAAKAAEPGREYGAETRAELVQTLVFIMGLLCSLIFYGGK